MQVGLGNNPRQCVAGWLAALSGDSPQAIMRREGVRRNFTQLEVATLHLGGVPQMLQPPDALRPCAPDEHAVAGCAAVGGVHGSHYCWASEQACKLQSRHALSATSSGQAV